MGLRERFKNFTNGRRAPPRAPGFLRYLTGWTITLALVFSFTGGGSDSPFALAARFGYWFIHIGTGLLAVSAVSGLLQRGPCACLPSPIQLAIYGLGGAIVFTPLAIVFETWWPVPGGPDGPPDWPMEAARDGWLRASLAEFGSLAPSFLGSWLLINLAYLVPARVATAGATAITTTRAVTKADSGGVFTVSQAAAYTVTVAASIYFRWSNNSSLIWVVNRN